MKGTIHKGRPHEGGERGGWPKSRRSKGGCVILVLCIKCGHEGEGVKKAWLKHIVIVPETLCPRTLYLTHLEQLLLQCE